MFYSVQKHFLSNPSGKCSPVMEKIPSQPFKYLVQVGQTLSNLEDIWENSSIPFSLLLLTCLVWGCVFGPLVQTNAGHLQPNCRN